MHKDKFIAPILHQQLESMEVKKNGKVEHSQNSHDDQVFSYLMALRVWYDGIDIAERYGIHKNTIKTDEDVDIETLSVESEMYGGMSPVDIDSMVSSMENTETTEVDEQLEYIKQAERAKLYQDFYRQKHQNDYEVLQQLINTNSEARRVFAEKNHLDLSDVNSYDQGGYMDLPDELFGNTELFDDEDDLPKDNIVGNLASQWRSIFK